MFASHKLIAWLVSPISLLLAGPLADVIFEPGMQSGRVLHSAFGWLVGTGSGTGTALQFVISGLFALIVGLGNYLFRIIRNAEDLLPDYDAEVNIPAETPESSTPTSHTNNKVYLCSSIEVNKKKKWFKSISSYFMILE